MDESSPSSDLPVPPGQLYDEGYVHELFDRTLDAYEQQCREFWVNRMGRPKGRTDSHFEILEDVADRLIKGVGDLARIDAIPPEVVHGLAQAAQKCAGARNQLFALVDAVWIQVGRNTIKVQAEAELRILKLLPLVRLSQPGWRVRDFLRRVSRCYIYGFDTECAVMCRSVLEAELDEQISLEDCITVLGSERRGGGPDAPIYDFTDRIAVARSLGRLDQTLADKANRVRTIANNLLHHKPRMRVDVLTVIEDALDVIESLSGGSKEPGDATS